MAPYVSQTVTPCHPHVFHEIPFDSHEIPLKLPVDLIPIINIPMGFHGISGSFNGISYWNHHFPYIPLTYPTRLGKDATFHGAQLAQLLGTRRPRCFGVSDGWKMMKHAGKMVKNDEKSVKNDDKMVKHVGKIVKNWGCVIENRGKWWKPGKTHGFTSRWATITDHSGTVTCWIWINMVVLAATWRGLW